MSLEEQYRKIKQLVSKKKEEKTRMEIQVESVGAEFKNSQTELKEKYGKEFSSPKEIRAEKEAQETKLEELISSVEDKLQ